MFFFFSIPGIWHFMENVGVSEVSTQGVQVLTLFMVFGDHVTVFYYFFGYVVYIKLGLLFFVV